MNTEITDMENFKGWVLFDAECRFCATLAYRFGPLLRRYKFALEQLQRPWVRERLGMGEDDLLSEMRLLTSNSEIYGGTDALVGIARQIWWAWPLYWLSRIPLIKPVLAKAYRSLAGKRNCIGGYCRSVDSLERYGVGLLNWGPAIALPVLAIGLGRNLAGWAWMWVLVLGLFLGAKWITIRPFVFPKRTANRMLLLAYLFLWPGLDAKAFFGRSLVARPAIREWLLASSKTLLGAALLWVGVPFIPATHPLVTGWLGMVGIVFLLHFGLFHLLSVLWRSLGIHAKPMMRSPGTATSLSKFWGRSWNAAFTDLMREHLFKPLAKHHGAHLALFAIFLLSGALHELVISLPARGGYGLPTVYFLIQGLGLLFERSKPGRKLGLGSGWKGWCFVAVTTVVPAFWLFHPVFIHNVILPMLNIIGAT